MIAAATGMLAACAEGGAPLSEVDPETGSTAVFTIAETLAALGSDGKGTKGIDIQDGLKGMIKGMAKSGANMTIPHKGQVVNDLLPGLVSELDKEKLLVSKWQYWVDDGVDGKSDGWYDYQAHAWKLVSLAYDDWLRDGTVTEMIVRSGWFSYKVSFGQMSQLNTSTGKQRRIRRMVCDAHSLGSGTSPCAIA